MPGYSGPPWPSCLWCSGVPCYPHPPVLAHPWVLRGGSGSPGCWGGTAHTGCCAVASGPACHGTGGSVVWDLPSCPVGTVGWPQAQLLVPGHAEAALSVLGCWAWPGHGAFCSSQTQHHLHRQWHTCTSHVHPHTLTCTSTDTLCAFTHTHSQALTAIHVYLGTLNTSSGVAAQLSWGTH